MTAKKQYPETLTRRQLAELEDAKKASARNKPFTYGKKKGSKEAQRQGKENLRRLAKAVMTGARVKAVMVGARTGRTMGKMPPHTEIEKARLSNIDIFDRTKLIEHMAQGGVTLWTGTIGRPIHLAQWDVALTRIRNARQNLDVALKALAEIEVEIEKRRKFDEANPSTPDMGDPNRF